MNTSTNAAAQAKPSEQLTRLLGALEQDAQNVSLTFETVDQCLAENQLDLAERVLAAAAKLWPDDSGVQYRCALAAMRRNNPYAAIAELEKIVVAGKGDTLVHYILGYANYLAADYAKARTALEPVLNNVDQPVALAPLYALTLQQLGETQAAIAFAERSLQTRPDDGELQGVLGMIYFDAGTDMEACRRYTNAALRKNSNHPMALITSSGLSMMDEQPKAALQLAEKAVQQNPRDGRAWSSVGLAHLQMMNVPAARQALQNAVQFMPGHIGTWHALAWTQLMQKDIDGAEASFNKALELSRTFGETQGGLAVIAKLRGDKERATALMNRAKRLAPGSISVQYLKLLDLQESGDKRAAQQFLEDVLQRRPSFKGDTLLDLVRRVRPDLQAARSDDGSVN